MVQPARDSGPGAFEQAEFARHVMRSVDHRRPAPSLAARAERVIMAAVANGARGTRRALGWVVRG